MKPIRKDPADFVQLTRGYLKDLRELSRKSPAAHQILFLLAEHMNKTNAVVLSHKTMGEILGYSPATIYRAVAILADQQWVQVIKIGTAHGYILNSKIVWRDKGGKRYASFYAEILVSESEQSQSIESWDDIELRHVPIIQKSENILNDVSDLPPPDQKDLLPMDEVEFPSSANGDAIERERLEKLGQARLLE